MVEIRKQTKCNGRLPVLKGSLKRGINICGPFSYKQPSDAFDAVVLLSIKIIYVVFCAVQAVTGAVCVLRVLPTQPPEKVENIHGQIHTHTEAQRDHQRGCYQIWTECIRGFSKEVFLDWLKASLVGHYCGWKNTGPTHDTFDLDSLVLAATTARDEEICFVPLPAPCVDPYSQLLFL